MAKFGTIIMTGHQIENNKNIHFYYFFITFISNEIHFKHFLFIFFFVIHLMKGTDLYFNLKKINLKIVSEVNFCSFQYFLYTILFANCE